ncbi:hypothetical protein OCO53_08315 [Peribacillus frigoritolerans]|uniref:hypothetical protein n=1 Tax=Peribacillus frigoritolerans TaxID=450367 RepID=UPI0021D13F6C|nr:hypothetical protein [Peribacillus frigoritolerans]MCU6600464.1 hypothetical protein [Peribacillus frigoritolerans]
MVSFECVDVRAEFQRIIPEIDDTARINRAIVYAQNNKIFNVYLAAMEWLVNGTIEIKDKQITLQGVYGGKDALGTKITTNGGIVGEPVLKIYHSGGLNPYIYNIAGVRLANLHFDGNRVDRPCIYMQNSGFDTHIENLWVRGFKRQGFRTVHLWDSIIKGLTIYECGTDGIYPAIDFDGDSAFDTSNANHIFGLHIENCEYSLRLGRARHNQFIACKIESAKKFALNSGIVISVHSQENDFIGGSIIAASCDQSYINAVGGDINNIPYLIKGLSPVNPLQNNTLFLGVDFATPNTGTGAKWFDVLERVDFQACKFHGCISSVYSMKLGKLCSFKDNQVKIVSNDKKMYLLTTTGMDNRITGNKVSCSNSKENPTEGTLYNIGDARTYVDIGTVEGAFYNLYNLTNTNNEVKKQRESRFSPLVPAYGIIDLKKTETNAFTIKSGHTITDILGGFGGQTIRITAGVNGVHLQNGFGATKIALKAGTNITLNNGQTIELIYMEYTWKEVTIF